MDRQPKKPKTLDDLSKEMNPSMAGEVVKLPITCLRPLSLLRNVFFFLSLGWWNLKLKNQPFVLQ